MLRIVILTTARFLVEKAVEQDDDDWNENHDWVQPEFEFAQPSDLLVVHIRHCHVKAALHQVCVTIYYGLLLFEYVLLIFSLFRHKLGNLILPNVDVRLDAQSEVDPLVDIEQDG